MWADPDFGPTTTDKTGAMSVYYNGKTPDSQHAAVEEIEWLFPEDYLQTGEKDEKIEPKFVKNDSSSNEVKQGLLGNCWFISALSTLASQDELIRGGGD